MELFKEKVVLYFLEYKRALLAGVFCLAGILFLGVHFLSVPGPESYKAAEEAVQLWKEKDDDATYNDMRRALKKVPSLEKKYMGAIAQRLFQRNRLSDAMTFAYQSIKALDEAPFHGAYAQMSLLIEQKEYQKALEQSVSLKEEMLKKCDLDMEVGGYSCDGGLLFAHNLLRIACLQQELHNFPGEKAAWEELENFLEKRVSIKRIVFENFRDSGLDLGDYILNRKILL